MKRNFTDSSQRAGHIAVGEMYLSKYLFYGKRVHYFCPRMSDEDVKYLDENKSNDKEWTLLRNEDNVIFTTRNDIIGLPQNIIDELESICEAPLKNGTPAKRTFDKCMAFIVPRLINGTLSIRK